MSTKSRIVALFVMPGFVLWADLRTVTDSPTIQLAILIGVEIVAPTLVNKLRATSSA